MRDLLCLANPVEQFYIIYQCPNDSEESSDATEDQMRSLHLKHYLSSQSTDKGMCVNLRFLCWKESMLLEQT